MSPEWEDSCNFKQSGHLNPWCKGEVRAKKCEGDAGTDHAHVGEVMGQLGKLREQQCKGPVSEQVCLRNSKGSLWPERVSRGD